MATQPAVVKQSDLLNQLVLDRNTMEELGRVEVLWMYPSAHRVLGFICKSGFLGKKKTAFKLPQIQTLGASSILVQSQPEATDSEKVQQLESLLHCEVWSDAGNKIGRITDYLFNLQTGEITHYLFASSGWGGVTGSIYQLPPNYILSAGSRRVLVPEAAVRSFAVYREGIHQKLSKAKEVLREDYSQVAQEWRSFVKQAQTVTEQAKERAQTLAEQAKEKAQTFAEQLQEETQTFASQAKTRSQEFVEQIKDYAPPIQEDPFPEDLEDLFTEPTPPPAEPSHPKPPGPQPQTSQGAGSASATTSPPTSTTASKKQPNTDTNTWDDVGIWDEDDDDPWV